jgi:hypothetical protein
MDQLHREQHCANLSLSILRDTGLHASDLNSNVSEDVAANLFLEVRVVAELGGRGREAIFACHFRQVLILAIGRKDHLAIDLLLSSVALDGVAGVRKDNHGASGRERQHQSRASQHKDDLCSSLMTSEVNIGKAKL